jgi:hypothetical protein
MPESSMQDIIASISRIIDEDNRTPNPVRRLPRERSGILELTDAIEDDGSVRKLDGGEPPGRQAAVEALAPTAAASTEAASTEAASAAELASEAEADEARDDLVSAVTAEAAVTAFARLGAAAGEQCAAPGLALGASARTLEEIVRDVLRPLLQAWLDDHLPGIVERLVQEEIQRLVREARPR